VSVDGGDLIRAAIRVGKTCRQDGALQLATRFWTGNVQLGFGARALVFSVDSGDFVDVVECESDVANDEDHFGFQTSVAACRQALTRRVSSTVDVDSVTRTEDIVRTGNRDTH